MNPIDKITEQLEAFLIQRGWREHFSGADWQELLLLLQAETFDLSKQLLFWSKLLISWDTRNLNISRSVYSEMMSIIQYYLQLIVEHWGWERQAMEVLLLKLAEVQIEQQQKQLIFWRFEYEKKQTRIELAEIDNETAQAETYNLLQLYKTFSHHLQEESQVITMALDGLMGVMDASYSGIFLNQSSVEEQGSVFYTLDAATGIYQTLANFELMPNTYWETFMRSQHAWSEKFENISGRDPIFSDITQIFPRTSVFMIHQIVVEGKPLGFIIVCHKEMSALDGFRQFFNMICTNIANAIQNMRLNSRINEMAIKDAITSVFNRHHVEERLQHSFAVSKRYNRELSVVMVDIDYFKSFNDTYGHQVGDNVLREVSKLMQARLRTTDIIGRYGGEEFIVILQETGHSGAEIVAQNLVNKIRKTAFEVGSSQAVNLTISAGYATFPLDAQSIENLIKVADEGLYLAKNSGRDQVGYTGQASSVLQ